MLNPHRQHPHCRWFLYRHLRLSTRRTEYLFRQVIGLDQLPIPEWLALGHTTIVEEAVDESQFRMDFRLTHPLFGQVFRYAGIFDTRESAV